jgi:hypothetical protein
VEESQRTHDLAIAVKRQGINVYGNSFFCVQRGSLLRAQKFAYAGVLL